MNICHLGKFVIITKSKKYYFKAKYFLQKNFVFFLFLFSFAFVNLNPNK